MPTEQQQARVTDRVAAKPQRARRVLPEHQRPGPPQPRQQRRHIRAALAEGLQQQPRVAGQGGHRQPAKHLPVEQQHVAGGGVAQHAGARLGPPQLQQRADESQGCLVTLDLCKGCVRKRENSVAGKAWRRPPGAARCLSLPCMSSDHRVLCV